MTPSIPLPLKIDTRTEHPYPLSELGKHLPTPRSTRTIKDWADRGMEARDKSVYYRLEYILIAGVRHSTVEAYHRLIDAVNQTVRETA